MAPPIVAAATAAIEAATMPAMPAPIEATTVWMTYAELAERLGITGESARNLVRRREWSRKPGNDGTQRVAVPADYLAERDAEATTTPTTAAPIVPDAEAPMMGDTVTAMEAHITSLRDALAIERGRADSLVDDLTRSREEAAAERARAEMRAEKLTAELAELATRFAASTDDARARERVLEAKLDAARADMAALCDRPWWRRLVG